MGNKHIKKTTLPLCGNPWDALDLCHGAVFDE